MKREYKTYEYSSKLSEYITKLVKEKRSLGFLYNNEAQYFYRFDKFIVEHKLDFGTINNLVIEKWSEKMGNECENSRKYRINALCVLAKYLHSLGIMASIPKSSKKEPRPVPYIPTHLEMKTFFSFLDHWTDTNDTCCIRFRRQLVVILRLYYTTGARRRELTELERNDINFANSTITINRGKADTTRVIFISHDMMQLLQIYDSHENPRRKYFFPSSLKENECINGSVVEKYFVKCWNEAIGTSANAVKRHPTLHCLRHAYVVNKVDQWITDGLNIEYMMPYLSQQLGHSCANSTYNYFHMLGLATPSFFIKQVNAIPINKTLYEYNEDF